MNFMYQKQDGLETVVAYDIENNRQFNADSTHPNFEEILKGLREDNQNVFDLFDLGEAVAKRFEALTTRISVSNGTVYFDGDAVENVLTDTIVRVMQEDGNFKGLVSFFDNVMDARNDHTREQLFGWLKNQSFALTSDGYILGFKGVTSELKSVRSGPGIVNGVEQSGQLDNSPGNVVEIQRSLVEHNPAIGCASGLHVGTYGYAKSFGYRVVLVKVHPRDVISVPTDCQEQKMRVVRYEVLAEINSEEEAWDYAVDEATDLEGNELSEDHFKIESFDAFDDEEDEDDDFDDYDNNFIVWNPPPLFGSGF